MSTQPLRPDTKAPASPISAIVGAALAAVSPVAAISLAIKDVVEEGPAATRKSFMRCKIGDKEYDSRQGQLILDGCSVALSTDSYSTAQIEISDPDFTILPEISPGAKVEIEIGFSHGARRNKFIGEVMWHGPKYPGSLIVKAVDPSQKMGQQMQSTQSFSADVPVEGGDRRRASGEASGAQSSPGLQAVLGALEAASQAISGGKPTASVAEQGALRGTDELKFAKDSVAATSNQGTTQPQSTVMQAASAQAAAQGDRIITRGNTVRQVAAGAGTTSGLKLDIQSRPEVFIRKPAILKRSPIQLLSGYGAISVSGYAGNDKQMVGATVVISGDAPTHPTGVISVPQWGQIKLSDPIVPGGLHTWGDATKNGSRVPESQQIMQNMAQVAKTLDDLARKYNGGKKLGINSWYRPSSVNAGIPGAARNSAHIQGYAVDFNHPRMEEIYRDLNPVWTGGLARKIGVFVHIDCRETPPKRRWTYPG